MSTTTDEALRTLERQAETDPVAREAWLHADSRRRGEPATRLSEEAALRLVLEAVSTRAGYYRDRGEVEPLAHETLRRGEPAGRVLDTPTHEALGWREHERREQRAAAEAALPAVTAYLRRRSIPAVRCSSARSVSSGGMSCHYWGIARYSIRLSRAGVPIASCTRAAGRDRSVRHLAEADVEAVATDLGCIVLSGPMGALVDADMIAVARWIARRRRGRKPS